MFNLIRVICGFIFQRELKLNLNCFFSHGVSFYFCVRPKKFSAEKKLLGGDKPPFVASSAFIPRCRETKAHPREETSRAA